MTTEHSEFERLLAEAVEARIAADEVRTHPGEHVGELDEAQREAFGTACRISGLNALAFGGVFRDALDQARTARETEASR